MNANWSDREILTRLREGDKMAFGLLYERYHHALYLNVTKLIREPSEAEDIVQEVFLTLWKRRQQIDPNGPAGGWLFTVSYHLSVDLLKKNLKLKKYARLVRDQDTGQTDSGSSEWQLGLLQEAISQLPPQKRKVIQLCKMEGKSYEQASVELGISKYTINEYLKDGMSFIRQYVKSKISLNTSILLLLSGSALVWFCLFAK